MVNPKLREGGFIYKNTFKFVSYIKNFEKKDGTLLESPFSI